MPILTPPRALPGLLMSIGRYVGTRGPAVETELLDLTVPEAFRKADREGGAELTFNDTLVVGERVGLLRREAGSVSAAPAFDLSTSKLPPERFLLEAVLGEPVSGRNPFSGEAGPAADLARTLCWFLDLDPMDPSVFTGTKKEHSPQVRLDMHLERAERDLVEQLTVADAAWNSFARWAVYLGLARVMPARPTGIIPDPYAAIRRITAEILGKRPEPIGAVLRKIGEHIPVLGAGRLAQQWHAIHTTEAAQELPPALSYTLFRLHVEGRAKLSLVGDADSVWRFGFGRRQFVQGYDGPVVPQTAKFSHIALGV